MGICPKHKRYWVPDQWETLEQSPISYPYTGTVTTPWTDPVSPGDCVRWPSSPACQGGGSFFDPCAIVPTPWPDDIERKCSKDGCECCTYITYRFLGFNRPPVIICHRKKTPECQDSRLKPLPPIPGGPPDIPPLSPDDPSTECGRVVAIYKARGLQEFVRVFKERTEAIQKSVKYFQDNYGFASADLVVKVRNSRWEPPPKFYTGSPFGVHALKIWSKSIIQSEYRIRYRNPSGGISERWDGYAINLWDYRCGEPSDLAPLPSALSPLEDDENMACCEETNDKLNLILEKLGTCEVTIPGKLIGDGAVVGKDGKPIPAPDADLKSLTDIVEFLPKLIASRLGTGTYPITVPTSLLSNDDDKSTQKLGNLSEFIHWFVLQFDALVGEFPIKIEIVDADAAKPGDQKKEVKLPNLAEAIAELYGLAFQNGYNSSIELDLQLRTIAEIIKFGNMSVETYDYAKAIVKHLGFKGNKVERKLPYSVNPSQTNDLDKFRTEVDLVTQGYEYEDKQTHAEQMKQLIYVAAMLKSLYWNEYNPKQQYLDGKAIRDDVKREDTNWRAYVQEIEDPNSALRAKDDPRLNIKQVSKGSTNPKTGGAGTSGEGLGGGLTIVKSDLASKAIRKTVGEKSDGIRKINSKLAAKGREKNWFFDLRDRFVGWLSSRTGQYVQLFLAKIFSWGFDSLLKLYYFDWNQSDKAIEEQIKANNLAILRSAGALLGTGTGWLVCTAVMSTVEFKFPVLRGKVVAELAAEGKDEVFAAFRSFLSQTTQALTNNLLLWGYSNIRKVLNPKGDYDKEGAKPWILAEKVDEAIDKIGNEYLRTFVRGFKDAAEDSLIDCFYTAGYLVQMAVDDHYAVQKQAMNQVLGVERTIEIIPDRDNAPDEKIRMHGNEQLLKSNIATTLSTHKLIANRDVGHIIGQPALDYVTARPLTRSLHITFREVENPPYYISVRDAKGKLRAKAPKQVEVTIPDPIKGISWRQLKEACQRFTWGKCSCTVRLDNGRQMVVHGSTKGEAESTMKRLLKLSTAQPLSWKFHEEGSKRNAALTKKPTVVYPSIATLLIRKATGEQPDLQTLDGKKMKEIVTRVEIWRDKAPPEFKPLS